MDRIYFLHERLLCRIDIIDYISVLIPLGALEKRRVTPPFAASFVTP